MGEEVVQNEEEVPRRSPLRSFHRSLQAYMESFAGYEMPAYYRNSDAIHEHLHTRSHAGFFDVAYKTQIWITGPSYASLAQALEGVIPANITQLEAGDIIRTLILNEEGGIIDDILLSRGAGARSHEIFMVVHAQAQERVSAYLNQHMQESGLKVGKYAMHNVEEEEGALVALQGPKVRDVLMSRMPLFPQETEPMKMAFTRFEDTEMLALRVSDIEEEGYLLSLPAHRLEEFANLLIEDERVLPIGFEAYDSLRLEAGTCLYGRDYNEETSPHEATLEQLIPQERLEKKNFLGAQRVIEEQERNPFKRRVGFVLYEPPSAHEGTVIVDIKTLRIIGRVTSGLYAPTLEMPITMGYIESGYARTHQRVAFSIGEFVKAGEVVSLPFLNYPERPGNVSRI